MPANRDRTHGSIQIGIKELQAQRPRGLPCEEIDDAATHGELTAGGDDGDAFVAVNRQGFRKLLRIQRSSGFQHAARRTQRGGRGGLAGKRVAAAEHGAAFPSGRGFPERKTTPRRTPDRRCCLHRSRWAHPAGSTRSRPRVPSRPRAAHGGVACRKPAKPLLFSGPAPPRRRWLPETRATPLPSDRARVRPRHRPNGRGVGRNPDGSRRGGASRVTVRPCGTRRSDRRKRDRGKWDLGESRLFTADRIEALLPRSSQHRPVFLKPSVRSARARSHGGRNDPSIL